MSSATERRPPEAGAQRRDTTISVRLSAKTRDLIDSAAELAGKSRSEFILESASQRATDLLLDQRLLTLDEEQFGRFVAALDNPPRPNAALRGLLATVAPWDR